MIAVQRIFMAGSIMQYGRSQRRCRYQKLLSVYLKSCGLGAKANDTTHLFGLTMSQSWVYVGIEQLAESNRRQMMDDIAKYIFYGGHDNLNLSFRVYEMRMSKQTHFDCGTAGTIYVVKDAAAIPPDRVAYTEQRAAGCLKPVTALDVFKHEIAAAPRLREDAIFLIKKFLLIHPAFENWQHRTHPLFARPAPVNQLPIGDLFKTIQYMLDTVHMEEASQDGNRKVLEEFLRQLGIVGDRALQEPFLKRLIIWIGDQLTVSRMRSLKRDRAFDMNFVQRFEQFLEIFGWFHAQLNEEMSLHKQYMGTSENLLLKHAFTNMGRKGLEKSGNAGNFHYMFRDALKHTAEARFRDVWTAVGKVADIADLKKLSPHELDQLANKIFDEHASTEALYALRQRDRPEQDDVFMQSVQFCRDLLNYLDLDDAMKTVDVGRMELLLPRLLFRYHGGDNHNYAREIMELMQSLWREWPDDLK